MTIGKRRDNAHGSNSKTHQRGEKQTETGERTLANALDYVAIVPQALYRRPDAQASLHVTDHTWKRWEKAGLRTIPKSIAGTACDLVRGAAIIEFMERLENGETKLPPAYKNPNAERNRARRQARQEPPPCPESP